MADLFTYDEEELDLENIFDAIDYDPSATLSTSTKEEKEQLLHCLIVGSAFFAAYILSMLGLFIFTNGLLRKVLILRSGFLVISMIFFLTNEVITYRFGPNKFDETVTGLISQELLDTEVPDPSLLHSNIHEPSLVGNIIFTTNHVFCMFESMFFSFSQGTMVVLLWELYSCICIMKLKENKESWMKKVMILSLGTAFKDVSKYIAVIYLTQNITETVFLSTFIVRSSDLFLSFLISVFVCYISTKIIISIKESEKLHREQGRQEPKTLIRWRRMLVIAIAVQLLKFIVFGIRLIKNNEIYDSVLYCFSKTKLGYPSDQDDCVKQAVITPVWKMGSQHLIHLHLLTVVEFGLITLLFVKK